MMDNSSVRYSKWDRLFIDVAKRVSELSTCSLYNVGCVIAKENRIISIGYNGTPSGMVECKETEKLIDLLRNLVDLIGIGKHYYKDGYFSHKIVHTYFTDDVYRIMEHIRDGRINMDNLKEYKNEDYLPIDRSIIDGYNKSVGEYRRLREKYNYNKIQYVLSKLASESLEHSAFRNIIHSNYEIHAEQNAIAFAAREGISTEGSVLYCTHLPCFSCAKIIISAGIRRVVYLEDYVDKTVGDKSIDFMSRSGVEVIKFSEEV